jgi:hypothetical protein
VPETIMSLITKRDTPAPTGLRSGSHVGCTRTTDYAKVLFLLPGISNALEVIRLLQIL